MVPTHRSIDAFIRSTCEHIKIDSWLPVPEITLQLVRGGKEICISNKLSGYHVWEPKISFGPGICRAG